MLCETCLGSNPYIRMTKLPYGKKLCKISNLPFQSFKWKAGPNGRYKETIISFVVAKEKNVCQACLNDMKFGVPVGVRDSILHRNENEEYVKVPQSNVGQAYYYQGQLAANADKEFQDTVLNVEEQSQHLQLEKFSRMKQFSEAKHKTAFRNLPKLCSFWLNGACTRVIRKTCPYRPCCGVYLFPEIAGGDRKDLCDQLIERLNAEGPAVVQKKIDSETKNAIQLSLRGNKDESIRQRFNGSDSLTAKYLKEMNQSRAELLPPEDVSIVTLLLGNIDDSIQEVDIQNAVQTFGRFAKIHIARQSSCAFIQYSDRMEAEKAVKEMQNSLMIHGRPISVNWAKAKPNPHPTSSNDDNRMRVPPPPGLQYAVGGPHVSSSLLKKRAVIDMEQTFIQTGKRSQYHVYPSMNPNRLGSKG